MTGQLEKITIDQELNDAEKTAIDALDIDDNTLMLALKEEKIAGPNKTLAEITTDFANYNVKYEEGTTTTDDYGNTIVSEGKFVCDDAAPSRLKNMIADKDQNDFAYFIYKISEFLTVGVEGLDPNKLNKNTNEQLVKLMTKVETAKIMTPTTGEIITETKTGTSTEKKTETPVMTTETLTDADITFDTYSGVTATEIVAAVEKLKALGKTTLESGKTIDEVIKMIKEGKILDLQQALGMSVDAKGLSEKADGLFGRRTLKNLEAGKVVKTKYVAGTEGVAKGGTKVEETSEKTVTTPNGKIIKIANIAHDIYTLTDIASLPEARGTGVEGNAKVYQIAKKYNGSEKTFRFFGNGRVGVVGTNEIVPRSEFVEKKNNKREWKENVENPIWVKTLDNLPKGFLDNPRWEGDTPKYYTVKVLDGTVSDYKSFVFYNNGRVMKVKNNKQFDMDYSINVLKKFKVAKKIESTPKTKTPSTEETVEKSANSSKEFEPDMYDKLTDEIEDIAVSEFVNAYKAKYPNIASCFATTSFVTQNEENPYFQITYRNDKSLSYNNTKTGNISLRDCLDANGNLDKQKFFKNVLVNVTSALIAMEKKEKNNKILTSVRGKTYTQQELFGNKYDGNEYFSSYFEAFPDNKVRIDASPAYTYISTDGKQLYFDLDDSGRDKDFNKNWYTDIGNITDANGNYNESKLKETIARIIERIIRNYY